MLVARTRQTLTIPVGSCHRRDSLDVESGPVVVGRELCSWLRSAGLVAVVAAAHLRARISALIPTAAPHAKHNPGRRRMNPSLGCRAGATELCPHLFQPASPASPARPPCSRSMTDYTPCAAGVLSYFPFLNSSTFVGPTLSLWITMRSIWAISCPMQV